MLKGCLFFCDFISKNIKALQRKTKRKWVPGEFRSNFTTTKSRCARSGSVCVFVILQLLRRLSWVNKHRLHSSGQKCRNNAMWKSTSALNLHTHLLLRCHHCTVCDCTCFLWLSLITAPLQKLHYCTDLKLYNLPLSLWQPEVHTRRIVAGESAELN